MSYETIVRGSVFVGPCMTAECTNNVFKTMYFCENFVKVLLALLTVPTLDKFVWLCVNIEHDSRLVGMSF